MDVSFISARKILPALRGILALGADVVVLVKPQFEVGRREVGRGGIVKDPELHLRTVREVAEAAQGAGYAVRGACASAVAGAMGNREFFLHLVAGGPPTVSEELETTIRRAVRA
jgi:23S rRNA (cytidine1920-2'-O)/16S rRNA (cytidine1409-2'-O)-methyltransferase